MNATLSSKRKSLVSEGSGELEQMGVQFREIDPFNLWVRASKAVRTLSPMQFPAVITSSVFVHHKPRSLNLYAEPGSANKPLMCCNMVTDVHTLLPAYA